jgi:hypothetical protein
VKTSPKPTERGAMLSRYAATVSVLLLILPPVARAECVRVNVSVVEGFQNSDLVFAGKLSKVEATTGNREALTFSVDRVWKGPATKHVVVYHPVFIESYRFNPAWNMCCSRAC